jgi:hypothetical protein
VKCDLCSSNVKIGSSSTTNLYQHLRNHHPSQHSEVLGAKRKRPNVEDIRTQQQTLESSFNRAVPFSNDSDKHVAITKAIAVCICKDALPISLVENDGFRSLIRTLEPRYIMPSRKHLSKQVIPKLYGNVKESLITDLQSLSFYSVTTDGWTNVSMTPFMSLTVHYITAEWTLVSKNLQTGFLPLDHTGENICDMIKAMLSNWNLDLENLVSVTTDNGSNMIAACRKLEKERISCFGHILNNAINTSVSDKNDRGVANAIASCRRTVSAISCSYKRKRLLSEAQDQLGITVKSLAPDCPTRWGSKYKMLQRFIHNEKAIRMALSDRANEHLLPTAKHYETMENIVKALQPYATLTDILSGDKYVSISAVLPMLEHILEISKPDSDLNIQGNKIRERIKEYVLSNYDYEDDEQTNTHRLQLLAKATVMDPRYRTVYITQELSTVSSCYLYNYYYIKMYTL